MCSLVTDYDGVYWAACDESMEEDIDVKTYDPIPDWMLNDLDDNDYDRDDDYYDGDQFWKCETCGEENHESDLECQYCDGIDSDN